MAEKQRGDRQCPDCRCPHGCVQWSSIQGEDLAPLVICSNGKSCPLSLACLFFFPHKLFVFMSGRPRMCDANLVAGKVAERREP